MTDRFANSPRRRSLLGPFLALVVAANVLVVLGWAALLAWRAMSSAQPSTTTTTAVATATAATPATPTAVVAPPVAPPLTSTPLPPTATPLPFFEGPLVYGASFDGRPLIAYRLGSGPSIRAIVGGIHGGYEWNTVDLVSETLTYFQARPDEIPAHVTLYIIPCANPDGYAAGTDVLTGRVNGNNVDLNRNWDYHWQMTATHGTRPVSAGSYPFSEPETAALRDFIDRQNVELLIFYHSAMAKIFSGAEREQCFTFELAEMMSAVTGYAHQPEGVPGQITTGDAIDYLSAMGITAIEVELTNHQEIEWERNLTGIQAFLDWVPPDRRAPQPQAPPPQGEQYLVYVVASGDTLSALALQYGVDLQELMAINYLDDPNQIQIGQTIYIPQR